MPLGDLPLVGGPDLPIGVFWPPHPYRTTLQRHHEPAATGVTHTISVDLLTTGGGR